MSKAQPRTFSHIGISVPSVEKAVKFYTEVLGWYLIMEPTEMEEDDSPNGEIFVDVLDANWGRVIGIFQPRKPRK